MITASSPLLNESDYPEHQKLKTKAEYIRVCREFTDWLLMDGPIDHITDAQIAEFFSIDVHTIEDERSQMANDVAKRFPL